MRANRGMLISPPTIFAGPPEPLAENFNRTINHYTVNYKPTSSLAAMADWFLTPSFRQPQIASRNQEEMAAMASMAAKSN
jgi:hypothetical protein